MTYWNWGGATLSFHFKPDSTSHCIALAVFSLAFITLYLAILTYLPESRWKPNKAVQLLKDKMCTWKKSFVEMHDFHCVPMYSCRHVMSVTTVGVNPFLQSHAHNSKSPCMRLIWCMTTLARSSSNWILSFSMVLPLNRACISVYEKWKHGWWFSRRCR